MPASDSGRAASWLQGRARRRGLVPAPWSYDRGTGPVDGGGAHHL